MPQSMPFAWTLGVAADVLSELVLSEADCDKLFDAVSFDREDVHSLTRRVPWSEYAIVLERIEEAIGCGDRWGTITQLALPRANGLLVSLAGRVTSLRLLYLLGARMMGPRLWPMARGDHADFADGRIGQTIEIDAAYRDSQPFFRMNRAILAAAPSLLGLPPSKVSMKLQPRRAVYSIEPGHLVAPRAGGSESRDDSDLNAVRAYLDRIPLWRPRRAASPEPIQPSIESGYSADSALLGEIEAAVLKGFAQGAPVTSDSVASELGISTRTLARRLTEHDTSFREIKDWVRREVATRRLARAEPISEVAYALGFSNPSSFHRAFKRWTGLTPTEFQSRNQTLSWREDGT